jgi:hypothetical protein
MEVWLESINDILVPHIFKGLQEAYNTVNRLTGGTKVLLAFQVTLEGIKDLSQSKITADYTVLQNSLIKNGHDALWFETLLRHLYLNYGKSALLSAGLQINDNFNTDLIEVPKGPDFVREVYINTAREIWQKPFLFTHKTDGITRQNNNNEIIIFIRNSIMRTVRDGLNLNRLLTSYAAGKMAPVEKKPSESIDSLRDRFKRMNQDNLFSSAGFINVNADAEESYLSEPAAPSLCDTVDNDNLASDQDTISDNDEEVGVLVEAKGLLPTEAKGLLPTEAKGILPAEDDQTVQDAKKPPIQPAEDEKTTLDDSADAKKTPIQPAEDEQNTLDASEDEDDTSEKTTKQKGAIQEDEDKTLEKTKGAIQEDEDETSEKTKGAMPEDEDENLESFKIYDIDEEELTSNYTIQSQSQSQSPSSRKNGPVEE